MASGEAQEITTQGTDLPTCPYCGFQDLGWWDGLDPRDTTFILTCPCGKEFSVSVEYYATFCTEAI